jgi:hypothetical protein
MTIDTRMTGAKSRSRIVGLLHGAILLQEVQSLNFLLDVLSSSDTFPNLFVVFEVRLAHESLVQSWSKEIKAHWVFFAHI